MQKYKPGEWVFKHNPDGESYVGVRAEQDPQYIIPVAYIVSENAEDESVIVHDGNIIAASPDLLKAAKVGLEALASFNDYVAMGREENGDTVFGISIDEDAVKKALPVIRAAIAKAETGQ